MNIAEPTRAYNLSEAASLLGVHRHTVRSYINEGYILSEMRTRKPRRGKQGKTTYREVILGSEINKAYREL